MLFEKFFDKINDKYINKINFENLFSIILIASIFIYIPFACLLSIIFNDTSFIFKISASSSYLKILILFIFSFIITYTIYKYLNLNTIKGEVRDYIFKINFVAIVFIYLPISSLVAMIFKDLSLLKPYEPLSYFKIFVCIVFSYILAYIELKRFDKKE
ncbi:hypothetical protein [Peptacetobacter sp.]|uniref:hypothetical protein n=1 Tax=Peptacetobacter sp. TaxID=2991975 RepID=UPI003AB59A53